jgi:hypothetical protein
MLTIVLFIVTVRVAERVTRLVVLASTDAEAIAKCCASRPGVSPSAFRVLHREPGEVMVLPRGRPPSAARVAAERTWLPYAAEQDAATIT